MMALENAAAAAAAADPDSPQIPIVAAATVALEARRSAADMRKMRNETDLASTPVHVQRLREENRRPNTRSTYSKCWRLWRVSAGPWRPPREATLTAPDRTGAPAAAGRTASWCGRIRRSYFSPTSSSLSGR